MNQTIKKRIEDINNGVVPEGYKQTPFGIFPCDWEKLELLDVCSCITKGTTPKVFTENGVRFVKVESIKDVYVENEWCSYIDQGTHQGFLARSILKKDDILFTIAGATIGKCAIIQECNLPANTNQALSIIRLRDKQLKWYVLSQLRGISMRRYVKDCIAVGAQPNISLEQMGKFSFYCSNKKKENIKIAEILMKWDEMVELQEQYIQKLELRKKGIMKKLLTPKDGWEKCRLNELVYKEKGKAVKIDNEGSIPIIDMEYLDKGVFTNYTKEEGVLANEQDILLLWDGASAGTLLTGVKGVVGSTFALLTLKNDKTCSKYLYYWLTIENVKNASLREGSGIPHMPKDYLQKQVVKYPILDKQIKISKTLALLEEEISLQKEKLEKIKIQRKAMQQYLLTGIVRV